MSALAYDRISLHRRCSLAGAGLAALSWPWWSALSPRIELWILLPGVLLLGLPHGAADLLIARATRPPGQARWLGPFLTRYLAVLAAALAGWAVSPTLSLFTFLAVSVYHFGVAAPGAVGLEALVQRIASGGAPVVLSARLAPAEIAPVFEALVGGEGAATLGRLAAGFGFAFWGAAFACAFGAAARRFGSTGSGLKVAGFGAWLADAAVPAILFFALPPLLAFALYFPFVHSLRHLLELGPELRLEQAPEVANRRLADGAILAMLTALSVALGLALFAARFRVFDWPLGVTGATFQMLAAVTIPHVLLVASWQARRAPQAAVADG